MGSYTCLGEYTRQSIRTRLHRQRFGPREHFYHFLAHQLQLLLAHIHQKQTDLRTKNVPCKFAASSFCTLHTLYKVQSSFSHNASRSTSRSKFLVNLWRQAERLKFVLDVLREDGRLANIVFSELFLLYLVKISLFQVSTTYRVEPRKIRKVWWAPRHRVSQSDVVLHLVLALLLPWHSSCSSRFRRHCH